MWSLYESWFLSLIPNSSNTDTLGLWVVSASITRCQYLNKWECIHQIWCQRQSAIAFWLKCCWGLMHWHVWHHLSTSWALPTSDRWKQIDKNINVSSEKKKRTDQISSLTLRIWLKKKRFSGPLITTESGKLFGINATLSPCLPQRIHY